MSPKEKDFYNNRSDFLNNQGAYVYRNGRLMAWGDWFRLVPKGEATKLARVRIDFSNSLDEQWTIDIKKSRAYPPNPVREQLRKIIGKISGGSTRVIKGKGKMLYSSIPKPVWLRTVKQGSIEYTLDREYPVINSIYESLEEFESRKIEEAFSIIESSIPIESIYADYTVNPDNFEQSDVLEDEEILQRLEEIFEIVSTNNGISEKTFRDVVISVKPFCDYENLIEEFIRSKFNE